MTLNVQATRVGECEREMKRWRGKKCNVYVHLILASPLTNMWHFYISPTTIWGGVPSVLIRSISSHDPATYRGSASIPQWSHDLNRTHCYTQLTIALWWQHITWRFRNWIKLGHWLQQKLIIRKGNLLLKITISSLISYNCVINRWLTSEDWGFLSCTVPKLGL